MNPNETEDASEESAGSPLAAGDSNPPSRADDDALHWSNGAYQFTLGLSSIMSEFWQATVPL